MKLNEWTEGQINHKGLLMERTVKESYRGIRLIFTHIITAIIIFIGCLIYALNFVMLILVFIFLIPFWLISMVTK